MGLLDLSSGTGGRVPTIGGPKRPRIATTLAYHERPEWTTEVDVLDPDQLGPAGIVRALLRAAETHDALVLDGSIGIARVNPDLVAATMIAARRDPPVIVIAECNWKPGTGIGRAARLAGIRAFDRAVGAYCVVSREEERIFACTWRIDPRKVSYTPFYATLTDEELSAPVTTAGGVFAGGNPMRDYGTLLEAVRGLDASVTIATSRPEVVGRSDLPPNVRVGPVSHVEYVERMRAAGVVVIPLIPNTMRSGGEQTYLNAMALGKVVIVNEAPGVRDYVVSGETGIIVPPRDPAALDRAIRWALDPTNRAAAEAMGARARKVVRERFTAERWVARLLEVTKSALERPSIPRG
jgi:hypothetical protein